MHRWSGALVYTLVRVFHLTREVRFAVNAAEDDQLSSGRPTNSYGGYPSLTGSAQHFVLQVTLVGELDAQTSYLLNIKEIDDLVRRRAIPIVTQSLHAGRFGGGARLLLDLFDLLRDAWPTTKLDRLRLCLTPTLSLEIRAPEHPMVRLSQKFEFCASHRLHNPAWSDEQNRATFGKCNNPHGHGHNYEVEVSLVGQPDESGLVMNVTKMERIVSATVIERFDHKNLNVEVEEFRDLMPSVENIAAVIYRVLRGKFGADRVKLASVRVWETPKTSCEYSE